MDKNETLLYQANELLETLLRQDDFFTTAARVMMKAHDALREAGFTEAQATLIVANQGAVIKFNS